MQQMTHTGFKPSGPRPRGGKASLLRVRLYIMLMALDQLCILAGFSVSELFRDYHWMSGAGMRLVYLVNPLYLTLALMCEGYSRAVLENSARSIGRAILSMFVTSGAIIAAIFLFGASEDVSRLGVTVGLAMSLLFLGIARGLFVRFVRTRYGSTEFKLVIIDSPDVPIERYAGHDVIDARALGLQADVADPLKMHELGQVFSTYDRVIVDCTPERCDDWALVLKGGNVIGEIVQSNLRDMGAVGIGRFENTSTLVIARGPLSLPSRIQKRAFDLFFTIPAIFALLPLLALVAVAIKLDSPGPVLFKQKRIGRGNRMFNIFKFRSMRTDLLDHQGARSASRDDDRITRVGRLIRRTSIDELPQLFNVLLGDMSIVGPRPHALGSLAGNQLFWDVDREYWCRHALKPGITGLAQVRGFRGATHHMSDLQNRLEADLEYVSGWTLLRDIHILFSTFGVLLHKNAY